MNLVEVAAERIKQQVLGLGASEKEWRVLVIDQETAELLHHSVPMSDVLAQNIALIERLDDERGPSPDFTAIYFVKMTSAKAKRIQKDFSHGLYPSMYVVSISPLEKKEEGMMQGLVQKAEKKRRKEKNYQFVYKTVLFEFVALSPDVFRLYADCTFYSDRERYLETTAERLRGLCRLIQADCTPVPVGKHTSGLASRIDTTGPGKLIVIERGADVSTPLMHFFTFESLLWEIGSGGPGYVLAVQKESERQPKSLGRTKGKKPAEEAGEKQEEAAGEKQEEEEESSSSGDDDEENRKIEMNRQHLVWESIKNQQLIEAHQTLTELVKQTTKSAEKEKKGNIRRLVKAVQELPAQTRTLKEIKVLMGLLEQCVGYFNDNGIKTLAEVEQGLATGKTADGKSFRSLASSEFFRVLDTAKLTKEEKYRVFLLLVSSYGALSAKEEKQLVEKGHLTREKLEESKYVAKCLFGRALKPLSKRKLPIARYVPVAGEVVQAILGKDARACEHFGVALPARADTLTGESLRKREFIFRAVSSQSGFERKVVIVYFIGGVTIAEITEIREIAKNSGTPILIGSTAVCSPNDFLSVLSQL